MLLDTWYTDTLLGIPGDEDGGGTCAFVVFSMMGLYPTVPGIPAYDLTSPVFDRVSIALPNGKNIVIQCRSNSRDNKYIQSIRLNGASLDRLWIKHADIASGAVIEFDLGNTPNRSLGSAPAALPPSSLNYDPALLQSK
jgi:putative alpha-1,2-mannosidase